MLARQNTAVIQLDGTKRVATAAFAAALGVFFLYTAAFSHSAWLHDAAHDTRHAITAPCH